MYDIITQLVGIGATVLTILSFQAKTQKGIMMIQSVSTILWTVHFFMLGLINGSFSGCFLNLLCAVRSIIYSKRESAAWARSISWVYVFTAGALVIYALQFTVFGIEPTVKNLIIQLFPTVGVIATNVGYRLETGFKVRCSQFISSPCWFMYNFFSGSIGGMITEVISFLSVIVGILRHDVKRKKA